MYLVYHTLVVLKSLIFELQLTRRTVCTRFALKVVIFETRALRLHLY